MGALLRRAAAHRREGSGHDDFLCRSLLAGANEHADADVSRPREHDRGRGLVNRRRLSNPHAMNS